MNRTRFRRFDRALASFASFTKRGSCLRWDSVGELIERGANEMRCYVATANNLEILYRRPYRYLGGLLLGDTVPGLIWVIGSEVIILRYHGHGIKGADPLYLAPPGWMSYVRCGLEMLLLGGLILGISSALMALTGRPDGSKPYRNAMIWGLPYALRLERLNIENRLAKD